MNGVYFEVQFHDQFFSGRHFTEMWYLLLLGALTVTLARSTTSTIHGTRHASELLDVRTQNVRPKIPTGSNKRNENEMVDGDRRLQRSQV